VVPFPLLDVCLEGADRALHPANRSLEGTDGLCRSVATLSGSHSPDAICEKISMATRGQAVSLLSMWIVGKRCSAGFLDRKMTFVPFDPLAATNTHVNEAALSALVRQISNILSSYVGWYDPFAELIQNALDSLPVLKGLAVGRVGHSTANRKNFSFG